MASLARRQQKILFLLRLREVLLSTGYAGSGTGLLIVARFCALPAGWYKIARLIPSILLVYGIAEGI